MFTALFSLIFGIFLFLYNNLVSQSFRKSYSIKGSLDHFLLFAIFCILSDFQSYTFWHIIEYLFRLSVSGSRKCFKDNNTRIKGTFKLYLNS